MGFTHITTCGSVGGGGGGGGSNVTSLNYDISTETLTLGTDAPSVFSTVWPIKLENTIHVAKNGNDADALASIVQPFSLQVPFLTIEAAYAASSVNDTIVVWPGSYIMTTRLDLDGNHAQRIHSLSGVKISNPNDYILNVTEGNEFWWTGYAELELSLQFYVNSGGQYFRLHVEAQKATNVSPETNALFMSFFETEFDIRITDIINLGFDGSGWNKGFIGIDTWGVRNEPLFSFANVSSLYDTLGTAHVIVGGKTTEKVLITRTQPSGIIAGIDLPATIEEYYKRKLEIIADVDWMDGYFLNHNNGTVLWKGNAIHRKSDLLGNELPLYSSTTPSFAGQVFKPYFEHWGTIVTDSVEVDQPKLFNNTIVDIRIAGSFILHSTMQCSGQDVGSGAFSCVSISNADLDGTTNVVFDGIFKTGRAADVGPIKINELGNSLNNPLKIQFLDTLAICENSEKTVGPIYSTSATNIPIYLYAYHSLGMTGPFDPGVFSIGLSVDNSYYDTSVSYEVMDYKGP